MTRLRIGLTGGIASGKSQVGKMFMERGIELIDADKIARSLFDTGSSLLDELKIRFGGAIFNSDNSLDRKALGKIVFNSEIDLAWLNQLTHPLVARQIDYQLSKIKSPYVILDIPLLVNQSGEIPPHLKNKVDRVLVVSLQPDKQLERLCSRDKLSNQEALKIIANQSSLEQKLALADDIIDNNRDLQALDSQVEILHNMYLKLSSKDRK